jgi:hypothetical protein
MAILALLCIIWSVRLVERSQDEHSRHTIHIGFLIAKSPLRASPPTPVKVPQEKREITETRTLYSMTAKNFASLPSEILLDTRRPPTVSCCIDSGAKQVRVEVNQSGVIVVVVSVVFILIM